MKITISKKSNKWIYLLSMLFLLTYSIPNVYGKVALIAIILYAAWIWKLCNPTLLRLIAFIVINFEISSTVLIIAALPTYFGRPLLDMRISPKNLVHAAVTVVVLLISLMTGEDPNYRTMVLFMLCFAAYFTVANGECTESELKAYAISGIIITVVSLVVSNAGGGTGLRYGRLSINGSIRELANAVAISLFLLLSGIIGSARRRKRNYLEYAVVALGGLILFATLSNGAIIALIAGVAVIFLMNKMAFYKKVLYAGLLCALFLVIVKYLSSNDALSTDRLLQSEGGFNGRFDIWLSYLKGMSQSTGRLLFGFGPGDVRRLGISNNYSHSLFFDILFSYGILGSICVFGAFIRMGWGIFSSRNASAMGVAVFAVLLYATHGVSTATSLYILLGIATSLAKQQGNTIAARLEGGYPEGNA